MNLNNFDLNLLRGLDALLSERNVTRAAHRLSVTQQAMSGSLRRLREQFGDELLVRAGRTLRLTALGAALQQPVHKLVNSISSTLEEHLHFDPVTSHRRVRIGKSDFATLGLLPPLMAYLSSAAPNIVCDVGPVQQSNISDLEAGKLDFLVLPTNWRIFQGPRPTDLRSVPLYSDDFVCVIDRDHPTIGETMTREQYLNGSHNLPRLGGGMRSIIEESWLIAGVTPRVIATTPSFASLIWMIPGTPLIATAQRRLAKVFAAMLPIRTVECPIPIEALQADLLWNVCRENDAAYRFMQEAFLLAAGALDS